MYFRLGRFSGQRCKVSVWLAHDVLLAEIYPDAPRSREGAKGSFADTQNRRRFGLVPNALAQTKPPSRLRGFVFKPSAPLRELNRITSSRG
jgi:hypothetical protein